MRKDYESTMDRTYTLEELREMLEEDFCDDDE
jgi:hypothetical protein